MPTQGSEGNRPLVVELVGPLIDDGGSLSHTLTRVVAGEGVELRPGAVEQVVGAAAGWALTTLLEGHGRPVEGPRLAELEREVIAGWVDLLRTGRLRSRPAALEAVRKSAASRPVAVLTGLPDHVAVPLLDRGGDADPALTLIAAGGVDGLPRPDRLSAWLATVPAGAQGTAFLSSASAMLAAIGAGCAEVVLVGDAGPAAEMLAERRVTDVAAALAG